MTAKEVLAAIGLIFIVMLLPLSRLRSGWAFSLAMALALALGLAPPLVLLVRVLRRCNW